jgi:hypothetical protein
MVAEVTYNSLKNRISNAICDSCGVAEGTDVLGWQTFMHKRNSQSVDLRYKINLGCSYLVVPCIFKELSRLVACQNASLKDKEK